MIWGNVIDIHERTEEGLKKKETLSFVVIIKRSIIFFFLQQNQDSIILNCTIHSVLSPELIPSIILSYCNGQIERICPEE